MKALIQRLNKMQREMKALKGRTDPSGRFSYRSAEDIMQAIKPFLGTNAVLMCKDSIESIEGTIYVKATVALTDGENSLSGEGWAEVPDTIMSMSKPQITGACSSYARKYALQGLFALDDNPDIDSSAQYAEELEEFTRCINENNAFDLFYLTCDMEPEAQAAVWNMYKKESIPKGEIGIYRQRISDLKEQGKQIALAAQDAFESEDDTEAAEAMAEFTTEQVEFIKGLAR